MEAGQGNGGVSAFWRRHLSSSGMNKTGVLLCGRGVAPAQGGVLELRAHRVYPLR